MGCTPSAGARPSSTPAPRKERWIYGANSAMYGLSYPEPIPWLVVERSGSWQNRFRMLLIRAERKAQDYLALVYLACCLIVYRLIVLG